MLSDKDLIALKEKIDKAQELKNRYEGQLEQLHKSLKELGYSSVDEAKEDLEKLRKKHQELQKQIEILEGSLLDLLDD